jgi:UDP-N-acetylglucosamine 2-epimerase
MTGTVAVVAGVRPHYLKAPPFVSALRSAGMGTIYIDARQHYDPELTALPQAGLLHPDVLLEHPDRDRHHIAASIYVQLVEFVEQARLTGDRPALVAIGDTTTSFMTASAAVATGARLVHLEAGIRSAADPASGVSIENHYRRMIGQASDLNLCVLPSHAENLARESVPGRSVTVGDLGPQLTAVRRRAGDLVLVHVHKSENSTRPGVSAILGAVGVGGASTIVIANPSIRGVLADLACGASVEVVPPMCHDDLIALMARSRVIVTDSGSTQREAAQLGCRCVVRRDTAGWTELFESGGHIRVGRSADEIEAGVREIWDEPEWRAPIPPFAVPDGMARAAAAVTEVLA